MRRLAAALLLWLAAGPLAAADFHGVVSHVTDGDTLWVRPAGGGAPVELRLLHLDAPEGCQVFGAQSTAALQQRVLHQRVQVRTVGQDDYDRGLAQVQHRGEDVGAWLVRQGLAWSSSYKRRPGPYARLEADARREGRGLWALPEPLEPRQFRKRFGRCR